MSIANAPRTSAIWRRRLFANPSPPGGGSKSTVVATFAGESASIAAQSRRDLPQIHPALAGMLIDLAQLRRVEAEAVYRIERIVELLDGACADQRRGDTGIAEH